MNKDELFLRPPYGSVPTDYIPAEFVAERLAQLPTRKEMWRAPCCSG